MNSSEVFLDGWAPGNLATMLQIPPNCDLTLGLSRIDDEPGSSVWRVRVDERFLNPAGTVQGGFLAAVADSAMGAAAVLAAGDRRVWVANVEMKISLLRAVRPGAVLTCRARVVKSGQTVTFVEAEIADAAGSLVATTSSTYLVRDRTE